MMIRISVFLITVSLLFAACGGAPANRVGSEAWCEELKEKPKGDWTLEETKQYAKYCMLGMDFEKWCEKMEKKPKEKWTGEEAATYAENCIFGRSEKEEGVQDRQGDE
jgi:hypothetical protein